MFRICEVIENIDWFSSIDSGAGNLSWESPMSERTRSSSEERDEAVESSSLGTYGNGLQDIVNTTLVKSLPVDHATYPAKRKTPTPTVRKASQKGLLKLQNLQSDLFDFY